MKTLLAALILSSASTFAQVPNFNMLQAKFPKLKAIYGKGAPAPGQIQPVRQAKMKATISKDVITFDSTTGTSTSTSTPICTQEVDVPVYDLRGQTEGQFGAGLAMSCTSTIGSQPAVVEIYSSMVIFNASFFDGEPTADFKFASGGLYVTAAAPGQFSIFSAGSRDISTKSFIGHAGQGVIINCSDDGTGSGQMTCKPLAEESFSAVVEFKD